MENENIQQQPEQKPERVDELDVIGAWVMNLIRHGFTKVQSIFKHEKEPQI
jgi:hypothetical protein